MFRPAMHLAAMILLASSAPAMARRLTVNDLLRTETFGEVSFGPNGRWLVFARLAPIIAMTRFDMEGATRELRSQLYRVDLNLPWRAVPLIPGNRPGVIAYGFSPNGDRLAVGRLKGDQWQLGVVTMATSAVRWFDLAPDYSPFDTSVRWVSNRQLVAIVDPNGKRPWWLRTGSLPADTLPARWAATRSGTAPAVTAIGSGRLLSVTDEPPKNRLMLVDTVSGSASTLASGRFLSMAVAPDRRHLALIEQGAVAPLPVDRPVSQIDWPFRRIVSIYDLASRQLWRPCPACDVLGKVAWSPDSRSLAFFARKADEDWPAATLFRADTPSRMVRRLNDTGIVASIAQLSDGAASAGFAWRGTGLLLFGRPSADSAHRAEWYTLNDQRPANALTSTLPDVNIDLAPIKGCSTAMTVADGIWCLDGRTPRKIFDAPVHISDGTPTGWRTAAGQIIFAGGPFGGRRLAIGATARVEQVDASATGRAAVVRTVADDGVRTLALVTADHAAVIARANLSLRDVQPAIARPLHHRVADGQVVTSWLYLPPGVPEREKHALIVVPYPGQSYGAKPPLAGNLASDRLEINVQLLAAHGYAVLLPSLPIEPGLEKEPPTFITNVDDAVDAAIATGAIDPDRIALWGHSYGAYTVATIVAHTCRYASAIASAGTYDLGGAVGVFEPTLRLAPAHGVPIGLQFAWAETGQGRLGVPPWADPSRYVSASPFYRAGQISTPMLIIAADRDASPLEQAEEMFSALFRQDKDAELVTYWGEGHVIGSPANVRDLYRREFQWLSKTLRPPRENRCSSIAFRRSAPATREPIAP